MSCIFSKHCVLNFRDFEEWGFSACFVKKNYFLFCSKRSCKRLFKVFLPESMHTCCPLPSWDSLSRRCRRGRAWAWPRRFGSRGGPEPHRPRGCWGCKTKLKTRQRSMVMMFCVGKSFSNVFCGRKICEEWNKYRITVEVLIYFFFVRIHVFFFQHT